MSKPEDSNPRAENPTGAARDEEYEMPCAEALLAGALALMTGHAQACCDHHRDELARKIVENLSVLSQHAMLSPDFKTVVWSLHTRWVQHLHTLAHHSGAAEPVVVPEDQRVLWHSTPDIVQ